MVEVRMEKSANRASVSGQSATRRDKTRVVSSKPALKKHWDFHQAFLTLTYTRDDHEAAVGIQIDTKLERENTEIDRMVHQSTT